MNMLDEAIAFIGLIIGGITALILAIVLCMAGYNTTFMRWACTDYAEFTGLKTSFTVSAGCYVQLKDGTVLPLAKANEIVQRQYAHKYNLKLEKE